MILLFDSGLMSPVTKEISYNTQQYLASAIGMKAQVQPTELSLLTAEMTKREHLLTQREADLAAREISVDLETGNQGTSGVSTYILSVLLFVILVLIVLNYVLDYMRLRERVIRNTHENMA